MKDENKFSLITETLKILLLFKSMLNHSCNATKCWTWNSKFLMRPARKALREETPLLFDIMEYLEFKIKINIYPETLPISGSRLE